MRPDEPVPVLFRDLGPTATARFLRGALGRLAGPLSPITYLRTWRWEEPYVDHGRIGRLAFLRPATLQPWHAGLPHVYVADGALWGDRDAVGWVPPDVSLEHAAAKLTDVRTAAELREAFGGREHDGAVQDAVGRIATLDATLAATEPVLAPLRRAVQRGGRARDEAAATLARLGIDEDDLTRAWHHLPAARRDHLAAVAGSLR